MELGIEASAEQRWRLLRLAQLLESWANQINLTGHRSTEAIVLRLVLDAAALLGALPPLASLADIGSGAGFPGLVIGVLRPGASVTLIESRERRHHFQRAAIRELKLDNVEPLLGRAESLDPRPHAASVAQAVGPPTRVLPWLIPWTERGGLLLLPGSLQGSSPATRVEPVKGSRFERRATYQVPCGGPLRTLWIGRRAEPGDPPW